MNDWVRIFDTTLRDGEQSPGASMTTEEKVRLSAHCGHFAETLALKEPQGRKLGFITQEMGREINTIGSKANDAAMQRNVVLMKDELEKIKEQVLNVL